MQSDPTRVASHDLHHQHTPVAVGGGAHPIQGLGRNLHRGQETKGDFRTLDVVVDGLRHADHIDARVHKGLSAGHGAVTSDHHQGRHALFLHALQTMGHAVLVNRLTIAVMGRQIPTGIRAVGRAQNRPPRIQDPAHILQTQRSEFTHNEAFKTILDTNHLDARRDGFKGHHPNHCIEARAVAPASQDADALGSTRGSIGCHRRQDTNPEASSSA